MNYLNEAVTNSTVATVTDFLNAITYGCSNSGLSLDLSGGYNTTKEQLGMNVVVEITASRNV